MKLWLIAQDQNNGYDTYDSAVVAAETEEQARQTNPQGTGPIDWGAHIWDWCDSPDQVIVKLLGEAAQGVEAGVICASFNAG